MSNAIEGPSSLTDELWREYEWLAGNNVRHYRINDPQELYFRCGGSTHRVLDSNGIVHCVPAPGNHGCVLRWKSRPDCPAVRF